MRGGRVGGGGVGRIMSCIKLLTMHETIDITSIAFGQSHCSSHAKSQACIQTICMLGFSTSMSTL